MAGKITEESVGAFLRGEEFHKANMSVKDNALYLHGNCIAKYEDGQLSITDAGWPTNTTKERLNYIPGVSIYQKAGVWYLNDEEWDGSWVVVA